MSKFMDVDCPHGTSRESFSLEFHDKVTEASSSIRAIQAHLGLALAGGARFGRSIPQVEGKTRRLTKDKFRSNNSTPRRRTMMSSIFVAKRSKRLNRCGF